MIEKILPPRKSEKILRRGKPLRLGFAGVGWIGRHRMDAAVGSGIVEVAALADPLPTAIAAAIDSYPAADVCTTFEDLLDSDLDGIVLATPSALHASQAIAALERGFPVFCQKPLGRNARETAAVIAAAESADLLLDVDLSYRFTEGMQRIKELVSEGELGDILSIECVFHNAYGPDKPWFYSRRCSGGGCLLDLGIHLVDLALWCLDFPEVQGACGVVHESQRGEAGDKVEDFAAGLVHLNDGGILQISTSWGSHSGCDAEIQMRLLGTQGGACFRNVNGSFYDFMAERFYPDRSRERLSGAPDDWGGRAIHAWVRSLADSRRFDPEIRHLIGVARVLDQLYLQTP